MHGDGGVVHVLVQRPAQDPQVLLQVSPQEGEDVVGPGVDHVADSLRQTGVLERAAPSPQLVNAGQEVSLGRFSRRPAAWRGA